MSSLQIAKQIAHAIVRAHKTRLKFSTLYREAIEEISDMSKTSTVTSSMNIADTPASRMPIGREIADNPASLAAASPAKLASSPSADSINSGMASSQNSEVRPVTVVPVDRKTICGSTPGDHRKPVRDGVTDALRQASGSDKGPRSQMAGQKNSRNFSEDGKGFQSTIDPEDGAN